MCCFVAHCIEALGRGVEHVRLFRASKDTHSPKKKRVALIL